MRREYFGNTLGIWPSRLKTTIASDLVMEMDHLRPRETYVSDDDDIVLVTFAAKVEPGSLRGRWTMTAEDVHEVFSGDFEVPVDVSDWRQPMIDWYRPEQNSEPDG